MKSFNRAIDRFCQKHRNFGIPRLMLYIVMLTGAVYLFGLVLQPVLSKSLYSLIIFDPSLILRGEVWRLVTWAFIPLRGTGTMDFFFTLIALYFYYNIGSTLEREWGTGRFTIYYILGVLMHVVYGFIMYFLFGWHVFVNPGYISLSVFFTPTYLNLSMFFAFAAMYPNHTIRLFLIIPVKMKWAAWLNAAFFVFGIISNLAAGLFIIAFLPIVAILNFFLFCGEDLLSSVRPVLKNIVRKPSPQVINFKQEARKVKREMNNKPYRHKCAVCGITDTDNPDAEFRYCSQCAGYHCFCSEHINNHIHFEDQSG